MQAKYVQRGEHVDFRPDRDVPAGQIVIIGKLVGVAKLSIPANTLGSLALSGVYDVLKPARCAFSTGSSVYWDPARGSAVTTGENFLGLAVQTSRIEDQTVRVILNSGGVSVENTPTGTIHWQTI